jgi:hypothetical protein
MVRALAGALLIVAATFSVAPAADPIRVGAIFSITGPASFLGEPERNTAKKLEEDLSVGGLLGRMAERVVYDDESEPTNLTCRDGGGGSPHRARPPGGSRKRASGGCSRSRRATASASAESFSTRSRRDMRQSGF